MTAILDVMPNTAVLLDRYGRIVQTNAAADRLLQASDVIAFDSEGGLKLTAVLPGERQQLSRALKDALLVASGLETRLSPPLRISRPSGAKPLLVLAIPLPRSTFPFLELTSQARVLVVVVDPASKSLATITALRAAYGLTGSEARVALLLANGVAGSQIPAMLGVTPATINTHLRHCFEKTGTNSQVELARLFAMFPSTGTTKR